MKRLTLTGGVIGAAVLAATAWTGTSRADVNVTTTAPEPAPAPAPATVVAEPAPAVSEQSTSTPPNVPLLGGGIIALAGAYVPSVIVAAANDTSYDNRLYIPVVGPWLDLADRPSCGAFGQPGCGTESGYKALLVVDGAVQGLGALATVLGLVTPETHTQIVTAKADANPDLASEKADKASVHLTPAQLGHEAYGLSAFGQF